MIKSIKIPPYKYENVFQSFIGKGCYLLNTEEEFDSILNDISVFNKNNTKKLYPQFKYTALCGCENTV